jgi:hypothetical protein
MGIFPIKIACGDDAAVFFHAAERKFIVLLDWDSFSPTQLLLEPRAAAKAVPTETPTFWATVRHEAPDALNLET